MADSNAPGPALFPIAPHLSLSRAPWDEPNFQRGNWNLPPWAMSDGLLPILPAPPGELPAPSRESEGYSRFDDDRGQAPGRMIPRSGCLRTRRRSSGSGPLGRWR